MQPKVIILAGPPGSGKTTAYPMKSFGLDSFSFDERAAEMNAMPVKTLRAQIIQEFEDFAMEHIRAGKSFVFETILKENIVFQVVQRAQEAGFRVEMLFLFVGDFQSYLTRVLARSVAIEALYPEQPKLTEQILQQLPMAIGQANKTSLQNLPRAIREFDGIRLYDNSRPGYAPALVLEALGGKIEYVSNPLPQWLEFTLRQYS